MATLVFHHDLLLLLESLFVNLRRGKTISLQVLCILFDNVLVLVLAISVTKGVSSDD